SIHDVIITRLEADIRVSQFAEISRWVRGIKACAERWIVSVYPPGGVLCRQNPVCILVKIPCQSPTGLLPELLSAKLHPMLHEPALPEINYSSETGQPLRN